MSSKSQFNAMAPESLLLLLIIITITSLHASPAYSGSVVGQIAGVSPDSFSLHVSDGDGHILVDFLIGPATRIDGQLKVGAKAGVEYMFLGNCNFATHVVTDSTGPPLGD